MNPYYQAVYIWQGQDRLESKTLVHYREHPDGVEDIPVVDKLTPVEFRPNPFIDFDVDFKGGVEISLPGSYLVMCDRTSEKGESQRMLLDDKLGEFQDYHIEVTVPCSDTDPEIGENFLTACLEANLYMREIDAQGYTLGGPQINHTEYTSDVLEICDQVNMSIWIGTRIGFQPYPDQMQLQIFKNNVLVSKGTLSINVDSIYADTLNQLEKIKEAEIGK